MTSTAQPERCKNHLSDSGIRSSRRCRRAATGEDRLCNVCRSAKARGEAKSQASYNAQTARIARQNRLQEARGRVLREAKAWVHAQEDHRASHEALRDAVLALIEAERS